LAGIAAAIILLSFLVPLVRGYIARSAGASQMDERGPGAPSIRVSIQRGRELVSHAPNLERGLQLGRDVTLDRI
jgi:hypothetical protein